MSNIKLFLITCAEIANFILLWNTFNKGSNKQVQKGIFIVFSTALVIMVTKQFYPSMLFIFHYCFLLVILKIFFKKSIKSLFLEFSLIILICMILQLISISVIRIIQISLIAEDVFLNNLSASILALIITLLAVKLIKSEGVQLLYKQTRSKIYFFTVNLFLYIIAAKWLWNYKRQIVVDEALIFILIPAAFIIGNTVYLIYQIRNSELKKALESFERYSPVISQLLDDVRRRHHDFKNHLNTIYGLIQISDEKALKETISSYTNSLNVSLKSIDDILSINNAVVTAIIYNKINEAIKYQIQFKYGIRNDCTEFPFEDYEMSEVLNNLLDNAFEAIYNSNNEVNKKVFLNIGWDDQCCIVEVGNTGKKIEINDIQKLFDKEYSTKKSVGHGYGLYNVKKIVDYYDGKILHSYENGYTIFTISVKAKVDKRPLMS